MLISFRRHPHALLLGCSILAASHGAHAAPAAAVFPNMYVGRAVQGTWNDLEFEIFYYQTIKNVEGPSNQADCVLDKLLNGIFVPMRDDIREMTSEEALQVDADYAAANPRDSGFPLLMEGMGMSISGDHGFGSSHIHGGDELEPSDGLEEESSNSSNMANGSTAPAAPTLVAPSLAQARRGPGSQDYKPTVQDLYNQRVEDSMGDRGALAWEMETKLGLYVEGVYLNRFDDIAKVAGDLVSEEDLSKELQDFVLEQAKSMVLPERIADAPDDDFVLSSPFFRQELLNFWADFRMEMSDECQWALQGDLAGDNPSLDNTTIIGRVLTGDFEGQTYDLSVFFEFYKLRGLETWEQHQCFVDAINSLFVTNASSALLSTDQQDFARSVIHEEHKLMHNQRYNLNGSIEAMYSGSVYWEQAGAQVSLSMGGFAVSFQKGAIVMLDGEYIRSYDDYGVDPAALRSFVNNVADPVHDDLKHAFPINQTSQLREFFLPMMMGPGGRPVSFKPMKDGTGIYPMLFMENLIYCVNASLLEEFDYPFTFGRPQEEEKEDASSVDNPELLDVIMNPPALGDSEFESDADDPTSLQGTSGASVVNKVFLCGLVSVAVSIIL